MRKLIQLTFCLFIVACQNNSIKSKINVPVTPESLLNISSERVSFTINSKDSVDEISDWANNDTPSKAELGCAKTDHKCMDVIKVLKSFSIPYEMSDKNSGSITFIYNKITAHDCDYLAKKIGNGNYVFGCATATNTIHMVKDINKLHKINN